MQRVRAYTSRSERLIRRTVVIDAVYEAHSDLGMVVGHQDDVEQLLAVWVQLSEARVDVHQSLRRRGHDRRR